MDAALPRIRLLAVRVIRRLARGSAISRGVSLKPLMAAINGFAMSQVNDDDQKLVVVGFVKNAVAAQAIRKESAQILLEGFATSGIRLNFLKCGSESLVEPAVCAVDPLQRFFCVSREGEFISVQVGA